MSLANVDGQEFGLRLVALEDVGKTLDRAPKRRSGEAAEDQHQRPPTDLRRQRNLRRAVEGPQPDIGARSPTFSSPSRRVS